MAVCETQTAYITEFTNMYLDGVNYDENVFYFLLVMCWFLFVLGFVLLFVFFLGGGFCN